MLQFLLIISLLIIGTCPIKLLSLTSVTHGWKLDTGLFLKQINLENENIKMQTIANLSQLRGYLSGTFNGSVVRFINADNNRQDSSSSYSVYSINKEGIIDKNSFTVINTTLDNIEQDGDSLFAVSRSGAPQYNYVLVEINFIKKSMQTKFYFPLDRNKEFYLIRASTYDTVKHIYYTSVVYNNNHYSMIYGINTRYFNYTTIDSQLPYIITHLMINANGTLLFATVYSDENPTQLISIDLHQNKTKVLVTYDEKFHIVRASTLGKNNKVFSIMKVSTTREYFFIITDLITNTYQSIQLDKASVPYDIWEV